MKKLFSIICLVFLLSGCNFLPRLNFDTPNTVPQSVVKGKVKEVCRGNATWDDLGNIKSCTEGYYRYDESYNKEERKMTIVERVKSFINNILGWGIPGLIVICILFPGAFTIIGTLIGRFIEGAYGAGAIALKRVAKAIQNTRKRGVDLESSLKEELDEKDKQYIRKLKDKEAIK